MSFDGSARILVVEDQPEMQKLLAKLLSRKGFAVHVAGDGETALQMLDEVCPDVVILDVELPEMDGLSFCRLARVGYDASILMVSGRADATDKVRGLQAGADDYLAKPFDSCELMARIEALLRRARGSSATSKEPLAPQAGLTPLSERSLEEGFRRGILEFDLRSHSVRLGGNVVNLTPLEFKLLFVLAQDSGRAFTRERLLELVWGDEYEGSERIVDTHIKHLRRKLGEIKSNYQPIAAVRGLGYRFQA